MNTANSEDQNKGTGEVQISELIDVKAVAALLRCSTRHVYRLSDSGKMPRPVKLGQLVRWNRAKLLSWIERECPPIRSMRGASR